MERRRLRRIQQRTGWRPRRIAADARFTVHRFRRLGGQMLRVRLDELLPARSAARALPHALDRLETGDAEQLVITRRNEPRAVLITVERYQELLAGELMRNEQLR
jgi:hypothetical protein